MAPPAELEKAARGVLRRLKRRLRPRIEGMAEVLDDPGIGAMFRAADRQRAAARGLKRSAGKATPSNILSESVTKRAGMEKSALVGAAMGALTMAQGIGEGHKDYKRRKAAMAAGVPAGQAFKMKAGELTGSNVMPYGQGGEKTAGMGSVLKRVAKQVGETMPRTEGVGTQVRKLRRAIRAGGSDARSAARRLAQHKGKIPGEQLQPRRLPSIRQERMKSMLQAKGAKGLLGGKRVGAAGALGKAGLGKSPLSRGPLGGLGKTASTEVTKMASLKPHVDITGQEPPTKVERETGRFYALTKEGGARYPIDTASQVQRAFIYFEKYASRFTPHERHIFCGNVARRADELGLQVPETIAKYGAATMAKDAGVQIYRRQRMFREGTSEHSLLAEMREKCASIKPEVLAVALERFDRQHNLDQQWDNGLPDPYFSIFGVEKVAEYSFVDGNDTVTEERLKICGKKCKEQITQLFDDDMAEEFAKDPVQIFDSLPLDSKRIIMRVAQQVEE
jgi:hypothetical protein